MAVQVLVIFILVIALIAFYKWVTNNNNYFEKMGLPYMKPKFIVGNTAGIFFRTSTLYDLMDYLYNFMPNERIFGMFAFRQPMFLVRDPDVLKKLTVRDFDHFENRRSFLDSTTDRLLGNSLFLLKGNKWRDMRATLSPAFTGSRMRQMFGLVSECANEMTNYFIKKSKANKNLMDLDMKEIFSRYANDVIATSAFGIKIDSFSDKDNEFYKTGQLFANSRGILQSMKMLILTLTPTIAKFLKIEFIDKRIGTFFRTMVLNNIDERDKKGISRPDMINLLRNVRKGIHDLDPSITNEDETIDGFATVEESSIGKKLIKRQWNDDEIVAQCFLFFLAGFETTSTLLTFAAYELTKNPDIQQKLYEEIKNAHQNINGRQIDYDSLQKMTYMDMVISETLRLWPPAGVVDRVCVKDYLFEYEGIKSFRMKVNDSLFIPIYAFHQDPKYFPNPKKFDPDRFSSENKHKIVPGTYMPFGVGPRNCIGSRFALMEIKAILYYLLLNFSFEPNKNTQIPLKLSKSPFGLMAQKPVEITLKLR